MPHLMFINTVMLHCGHTCSFAIEVARYRDPVKYSMLTELDHTPMTEQFAMKVT